MQANFYDSAIVGQREEQQDDRTNLILAGGFRLYVLADGMGGHNAGNVASKLVCSAFRDYFSNLNGISNREQVLKESLNHANLVMQETLIEQNDLVGMGTTVIAVLLHEPTGEYSFISVGDSPLYKFSNQQLHRINANHAFFEDLKRLVDAGEMTIEDANSHPDRHAITSAVMGKAIEKFDVQSGQFRDGDLLILASDGVQTLTDEPDGEMTKIILASDCDPETSVMGLLKAVEEKGLSHQDNTTLIVIRSENENSSGGDHSVSPIESATPTTQVELPKSKVKVEKSGGANKFVVAVIVILVATGILWLISPDFKEALQGALNNLLPNKEN